MKEKVYEITAKGFNNILYLIARMSKGETVDITIDHELQGVTPEMLDWWWLNMGDTERYKLWHPKDHISAQWEVSPEEDPFRATQLALEKIGGLPALLRIRLTDPSSILTSLTYSNAMGGCVLDEKDNPITWIVHEYESMPDGTRMRSTFKLPAKAPRFFREQLRKHCREEMAQFPVFLPQLYKESTKPR
jgi:hypothetical protein